MEKKVPIRQCLGCRVQKPKRELVRIVRMPDGCVVYDSKGKVSGRGAYICPEVSCFDKALKTKAIERSLGVSLNDDLVAEIKGRIEVGDE